MLAVHDTALHLSKLPLNDMIETLSSWRRHNNTPLFDFLARISLWKHPETKSVTLPPAYQTLPRRYFKTDVLSLTMEETAQTEETLSARKGDYSMLDIEDKLVWWREDPGLALHHYNWHVYYAYTEPAKDRQGELFAYMHKQMLARYDFERLGFGMERVHAFGPGWAWGKPLDEGYNPKMEGISFRPSGMTIPEVFRKNGRLILTDVLHRNKESLFYALARGYLECPNSAKVDITMDLLGNAIESNMGSVNKKLYGNLHNNGHCVLAAMNDPDGRYGVDPGPMLFTETAPRDPAFYRWHKFCDAFFEAYRVSLKPYTLEDLRTKDINIVSISTETYSKDPSSEPPTNTLYTYMESRQYTVYGPGKCNVRQNILNHVPFNYKLKVRNTGNKTALVVFRVFLAPICDVPLEEWRNMFVELDKFVEKIEGGKEIDILRADGDSSVVLPPETTVEDIMEGKVSQTRCGCGWPANLLIPRGTSNGMKTALFVLATNWAKDAVSPLEPLPGSVSYCGKLNDFYPDKRPMGFPFDRFTEFEDIDSIVGDVANSCKADVTVVHLNDYHSLKDEHDTDESETDTSFQDDAYVLVC